MMNHPWQFRAALVAALLLFAVTTFAAWPPNGWVYQLQNVDIDALVDAHPDVVVMDYSSTGGEDGEWTAAQIQTLQDAGITVLCYFSIGEAETYRFYWQSDWAPGNPAWLGPENPDWAGNYKVRYWMQGWRDILFGTASGDNESYLDRICDQGFDGVYLDIVDAYYYWSEENPENDNAAHDMVQLIHDLAVYARDTRGMGASFRVIPQNGEWIRYDAPTDDVATYYATVDGIGVEDVFYYGDADENNPYNPRSEEADIIDEMIDCGKVVLSVEYLTQASLIEDYYPRAQARGWTPVACHRDLDRLDYFPDLLAVPEAGEQAALPATIALHAWPNPFNASTTLGITLPRTGQARVSVVDVLGRTVAVLQDGVLAAGGHRIGFSGATLPSGMYWVKVQQGGNTEVTRVVLLK